MLKYFIPLFLGFVLIVSCASKDEKLQNYKDYIQKISNEIKFEDGFNTIKVLGERRSIFRSYFLNDELVLLMRRSLLVIEETLLIIITLKVVNLSVLKRKLS